MPTDEDYLNRAIRLAMNGRGHVEPNPMVGCVIVKDGRVIGEGFHQQFGGPHAEANALAACAAAGESPAGATAYVTLEPCCGYAGKKTPACTPRLIEAKVARVVIGCLDPNPAVNGTGVKLLREAGITVDAPLLEHQCQQLIAAFLVGLQHQRPYVTLKWAESSNGMVAGRMGSPVRITNAKSDRVVHELRGRCDAIAVGTNTVLHDDPLLTVRDVPAPRTPIRIALSNTLKFSPASRLVQTARQTPFLVFTLASAISQFAQRVEQLRHAGVEIIALEDHGQGHFSMADVFRELHTRAVTHLLIEPGPTLARSMLKRHQADRVWIFRSPNPIAEQDGLAAGGIDARFSTGFLRTAEINLDGDTLTELLDKQSPAFFIPSASADAMLVSEANPSPPVSC